MLAQCGRRVDGVDARVFERQVAGQVIADGAIGFGLKFQHFRHVGVPQVALVETGIYHRPHVRPVAVHMVGGQQHDHRAELVAVHRQVHAPLAHGLVPDHVGRPRVAEQVGIGILFRPCLPNIAEQRVRVAAQIVIEPLPMHHIRAARAPAMRAEQIVDTVFLDDCGIVHGHPTVGERVLDAVGRDGRCRR